MDGLLIGAGLAALGIAIPAIFRPDLMVRESARHHSWRPIHRAMTLATAQSAG